MRAFDAIVVGAGPAGSTAARELAAAGARTLVVERAAWPRYKACGGGIPLRAERQCRNNMSGILEEPMTRKGDGFPRRERVEEAGERDYPLDWDSWGERDKRNAARSRARDFS